jgi:hypothetical protein
MIFLVSSQGTLSTKRHSSQGSYFLINEDNNNYEVLLTNMEFVKFIILIKLILINIYIYYICIFVYMYMIIYNLVIDYYIHYSFIYYNMIALYF